MAAQLGLVQVEDHTLSWTCDEGDVVCPRRRPSGLDVSFTGEKKERLHGLRNAWRRSMWQKWVGE
eukprot:39316-Alexandrium_andersonii.AAC.1